MNILKRLCLTFLIIFVSIPAIASEDQNLQLAIDIQNKCHTTFLELWEKSKADDLNARSALLAEMIMLHGPIMTLPSNLSGDYITRYRDALLMSLYSVGPLDADQNQYIDDWYKGMKGTEENTPFGKCIRKKRSQECLNDLIDSGIIPPFESFAKEVDLYLSNGFKAHCMGGAGKQ